MVVVLATYLAAVVVLPLIIAAVVAFRAMPRNRRCPQCMLETIPVESRAARILDKVIRMGLHYRWCSGCGWDGLARTQFLVILPQRADAQSVVLPRTKVATQPIRQIRVQGRSWRVLLQSWEQQPCFMGRLLFVGEDGSTRSDMTQSLTGLSRDEVLCQAVAMSDGLLTYRLRDLVSD